MPALRSIRTALPRLSCAAVLVLGLFGVAAAAAEPEEIADRLAAVLAQRGLGGEAIGAADNILRFETPPPAHAEPLVREVLARPAEGISAEALFARRVPAALRVLAETAGTPAVPKNGDRVPVADFLRPYLADLVAAKRLLADAGAIDASPFLRPGAGELPSAHALRQLGRGLDLGKLERAHDRFLEANARLLRDLRAVLGRLDFPAQGMRFDSPAGLVVIGTPGNDEHDADAAVIVDPGGDDTYRRRPIAGGKVSVIIDLAGDDRYVGNDLVVGGLSAIIDLSGNDRYEAPDTGIAAAIGGISVVVDLAGDDDYRAGSFGLGAAAFGLGALVDLAGDDRYRIVSGGEGFGMAAGLGLLWDKAGNDRYHAAGPSDIWGRGGSVSMAQGAAYGGRSFLGGGAGILRDDAGDDVYEAEMFAQGVGYYYGVGLLWDRGGNDRYRAVRYAQGAGVHEAYGLLRDESGDDRYELAWGVGQGMGLDLAVGILYDGAGDDDYRAGAIAQGAATANGIGIAIDLAGRNGWSLAPGHHGWGRAEWLRGLPTLGFLLFAPGYSSFERGGQIVVAGDEAAKLGGPDGGAPRAFEPPSDAPCTPLDAATLGKAELPEQAATELLPALMPGIARGTADQARYAALRRQLVGDLRGVLAQLAHDDFDIAYPLGIALRCALSEAPTADAEQLWSAMAGVLADAPATPFAATLAGALRARPAPPVLLRSMLERLDAHPRCSVRSIALLVRSENAADAEAREQLATAANRALDSFCWREQAQGLAALRRHGLPLAPPTRRPAFLD